jgi:hypothetical protein
MLCRMVATYGARGELYKIVSLYHNMTKERHFVPIPILELWTLAFEHTWGV